MLDAKRLRYLDAIYRHKSFTRAGEELFVSQSAISSAVNSLEKELGVKLIVRNPKKVVFTAEGEQLMQCATRILRECEEAERIMADLSSTEHRTLHLGVGPTLVSQFLPILYSSFLPQWPGVNIRLNEDSMHNHLKQVENGTLDLAYNALPSGDAAAGFTLTPICSSEICAVMNRDHPLAQYEAIPFEALAGQPLCLLDEKARIRALVTEGFAQHRVIPHIVSDHEQLLSLFHTVHYGNYIGFVSTEPDHTVSFYGTADLVIRPLADPLFFEVGFIRKTGRYLPKIAKNLIEFMKGQLSTHPE